MRQLRFCWSILLVVFLISAGSAFAGGKSNKGSAKNGQERDTETANGKSNAASRGLPALPSLDGLTHGLGLGLRKRRGVPMAISSQMTSGKKPADKEATCSCPTKSDPVCASNGKTYSNKCMFQCAMKKMKSQAKISSKNTKKATKSPTLKIVKKGSCPSTESPSTTTEDPTAIVHQTATEITNTVDETLAEHLPMMSSMPTAKTPNFVETEEPGYIRSKSKH